MDLSQFLPSSAMGWLNTGSIVIAASSIFAASISKYTKNKTDDKIAGWLKKAHDMFGFFGFQSRLETKRVGTSLQSSSKSVQKEAAAEAVSVVRDHRTK